MTRGRSLSGCTTCFIAGTDTGVGKIRVTAGLLKAARKLQAPVAGMNQVAAGGIWHDGRLISEDAIYIEHN
jgi:dethiobiotin synthetase